MDQEFDFEPSKQLANDLFGTTDISILHTWQRELIETIINAGWIKT